MTYLRAINQRGTGVPERSIPMSNFCKTGIMSTCLEKDKGWTVQIICQFSRKASRENRCMYCVHDGEFCDNPRAQHAARHPVIVLKELQELLDEDSKGQEVVKPEQDEYLKHLNEADENGHFGGRQKLTTWKGGH